MAIQDVVKGVGRNLFKGVFPSKGGRFSGVGMESVGEFGRKLLKGRCVRVWIAGWQVLDGKGRVVGNRWAQGKGSNCVVFMTE